MKAKVSENCIGCGTCIAMCESVFKFNDEGFAEAKNEELTETEIEEVNNTIPMCPVEAISIEKDEKKEEEKTKEQ